MDINSVSIKSNRESILINFCEFVSELYTLIFILEEVFVDHFTVVTCGHTTKIIVF